MSRGLFNESRDLTRVRLISIISKQRYTLNQLKNWPLHYHLDIDRSNRRDEQL